MNWVNDYSFQRLNGKRNIPDTFAYMEWLHILKVRKTRDVKRSPNVRTSDLIPKFGSKF